MAATRCAGAFVMVALGLASPTSAGERRCAIGWSEQFVSHAVENAVDELEALDIGSGPSVYAGGIFEAAGGQPIGRVARWHGGAWLPLGSGLPGPGGSVWSFAVFDDGAGPAVFAGGYFDFIGGVRSPNIAKWDGSNWSSIGASIEGQVHAIVVFDDGSGPALYFGESSDPPKGVAHVHRWDGSTFSIVGGGFTAGFSDGDIEDLIVIDLGSGPQLYVSGSFTAATGVPLKNIARWNGSAWVGLGGGSSNAVAAMEVFDDGAGPALYATGSVVLPEGGTTNNIGKWNGSSWSSLGSGLTGSFVRCLRTFDDGTGPALYAGGTFSVAGGVPVKNIAKWNGSSWSALGSGVEFPGPAVDWVRTMTVLDDGIQPRLYVGGGFSTAGGQPAHHVAAWNGHNWLSLDGASNGPNSAVAALAVHDDGAGEALYVGGYFTTVAGQTMNRIARWDGSEWSSLGAGMNESVVGLFSFNSPVGPRLLAGGGFSVAGGQPAQGIAQWDGSTWSGLGAGVNDTVRAFAIFDDGSGPALHVGGDFTLAGGAPAKHVAKWDGATWSALGAGVGGMVRALATFDDGSGPALYVGGYFHQVGSEFFGGMARWDGSSWSQVGGFFDGLIDSMIVHDDGTGSALYAAGTLFVPALGAAPFEVGRWNGSTWSDVGLGNLDDVNVLSQFDDGSGLALYADSFTAVGGAPAAQLAKWDGRSWSAIMPGLNDEVFAAAAYDVGAGSALFLGGYFGLAGEISSPFLSSWGCTIEPQFDPADLNQDGIVNGFDISLLLGDWGPCPRRGPCPTDLNDDGVVNGMDLAILLAAWG